MRFINAGESMKIRIGKLNEEFYWVTLKTGETIELPKEIAMNNNLKKVTVQDTVNDTDQEQIITEGQIRNKKVETKQFEVRKYFSKELKSIKGIGNKTAKDLLLVFPTKESLIDALEKGRIPIRDDVEIKLREKYGL